MPGAQPKVRAVPVDSDSADHHRFSKKELNRGHADHALIG
jgi:hypothetical protein